MPSTDCIRTFHVIIRLFGGLPPPHQPNKKNDQKVRAILPLGIHPMQVFIIEGYLGSAEESNMVNVLKTAAAAGGTVLVTNSVKTGRTITIQML